MSKRTRQWPGVVDVPDSTTAFGHCRIELDNGPGMSSRRTRQRPVVIIEWESTKDTGYCRDGIHDGLGSPSSRIRQWPGSRHQSSSRTQRSGSAKASGHCRVGLDDDPRASSISSRHCRVRPDDEPRPLSRTRRWTSAKTYDRRRVELDKCPGPLSSPTR